MTTTTEPTGGTNVPLGSDNVNGAHTAVVSIGVILLVTIILVELAGTSRGAAIGVAFLFFSVIAIAGMTHPDTLQSLSQFPAVPKA